MKGISIDALPQPAMVIDSALTIQFANQRFVQLLGYQNERMFAGLPLHSLMPVTKLDSGQEFAADIGHADGNTIKVLVQVLLEPHSGGYLVLLSDESHQKQMLEESIECRLARALVSASDAEQTYQELLKYIAQYFGFSAGAVYIKRENEPNLDFKYSYNLPASILHFLHMNDSRDWAAGIRGPQFFSQNSHVNPISPLLREQGVDSMLLIPIEDETGLYVIFTLFSFENPRFRESRMSEVSRVADYLGKIVLRLSNGEKLESAEKLFRSLVRSMPSGLIVRDRSEQIVFYNLAAARLFGLRNDTHLDPQVIFKDVKVLHRNGETAVQSKLPSIVSLKEGRKIRNYELKVIRSDGSYRWLSVNSEPLFRAGEVAPYAAVATFRDITENRKIVQEIERARQIAEEASKSKSRFLANISHEIRTPLSGVMGMTDILLGSELNTEQREQLLLMKDAEESLLDIINKVLELSKIESGNIIIENNTFLLRSTVKKAVLPLYMGTQPAELTMDINIADDVPNVLIGDAQRVQQVLANLVSNAIKFTDRGRISVNVSLQKKLRNSVKLCFAVKDSGMGIPESELERIFENFQQVDSSFSKRHQGSGLGLSITRQLVEIMGGEIWVESFPGKGSSFFFTIDFMLADGEKSKDRRQKGAFPSHTYSLSILLAEDNMLNQKSISYFLKEMGHTVEIAQNGKEALEKLRRNKYDLVLMDVQMPVMNGLEATRSIRKADGSRFDPQIPIVALTAYAMKEDVHHILSSGMNAYVSKPLSRDILAQAIGSVLHHEDEPDYSFIGQQDTFSGVSQASEEDLTDFSIFVQDYQGDLDIAKQLLELFYRDVPGKIEEIEAELSADHIQHTVDMFHSLTNNLSAVRLYGLANMSRNLEREALRGNSDRLQELFPEFKSELKQALRHSQDYLTQINRMLAQ
ncbi:MAG: ATP-binding protein [Spirochaetota bacterium]